MMSISPPYCRLLPHIKKLQKFISKQVNDGKTVYVYGASTKGNTLLQYYGLTNKEIPFAAERSKTKWGKHTIGSGVKIKGSYQKMIGAIR